MRNVAGKHLCFLLLAFPLAFAEYTKKDTRTTENDTVWGQAKNRRLFARRKIILQQERPVPRLHTALLSPPRRCSRLMESCSSRTLCCDPCASCRCRLFNTICHCWRTNPLCLKRT
ncbi:agouti-signaling protein 2b isoform X2 [Eucyclogobius newberryi]|uniref:agouti-signaling protein 2b isoform X2 n=1 Tax=Eucyclogobius newberryi TaxID=166745 RepID=UPI003B593E1C